MKRLSYFRAMMAAIAVLLLISPESLNAIPAFARKYQISCQVCHSPAAPVLKDFGTEFAGNGFRMTEYESPRYFINTGDEKLSLFRELPLAIRVDGFLSYSSGNNTGSDFEAPYILKILSGGELSEKLSYYFYFLMSERGAIAGLEDAFLTYSDLLGTGVNISIGQLAVSDPLFKSELRLTVEPYKIYGTAPGSSTIDLKYDRGIIIDKGFSTGTTVVAEILGGNGIGEGREGFLFDKDKYKNYMLRITQSLGKSISVGFFGYTGREMLYDLPDSYQNEVLMYGPDVALNIGDRFMLNLQYLWRSDSEVYIVGPDLTLNDIMTQGGFAEIVYAPKGDMSKWYLAGLGNWIESDIDDLDYSSVTLHAGYLLRRNVRLVTEYTQIFTGGNSGKLSAGFVSAF